jgi:hypothetical protein
MGQAPDAICFYCGQAFSFSALNRVRGGRPCPVCTQRLLEGLPPLIPGPGSLEEGQPQPGSAGVGDLGESGSTWSTGGADFPEPA